MSRSSLEEAKIYVNIESRQPTVVFMMSQNGVPEMTIIILGLDLKL